MFGWRRRDERPTWVIGLLTLFLVLDIALVIAAVRAKTVPRGHTDVLAATIEPSLAPIQVMPPEPPPAPADSVVRLSAATDAVLIRSVDTRVCDPQSPGRAATLQTSTDGGATWTDLPSPSAHLFAVRFSSATAGVVTVADASCAPTQLTTTNGGRSWSASTLPAGDWFLLTTPGGVEVHAPKAVVSAPCPSGAPAPSELAAVSLTSAHLLCTGPLGAAGQPRVLYRTTDAGRSWTPVAGSSRPATRTDRPDGLDNDGVVLALAASSSTAGAVALSGTASCPGIEVRVSSDGGRRWTGRNCVPGSPLDRAALAYANAEGLALVGLAGAVPRTARSADGGRSWSDVTVSG